MTFCSLCSKKALCGLVQCVCSPVHDCMCARGADVLWGVCVPWTNHSCELTRQSESFGKQRKLCRPKPTMILCPFSGAMKEFLAFVVGIRE